jgi:hypothetical protein
MKKSAHSLCKPGAPKGFVKRSAKLVSDASHATLMMPTTTASLTLWYAMALRFFLIVDYGLVQSNTTLSLSQNTLAGPATGIPSIHSL